MSDDKLELNRRRVLAGLATIGAASAAAGAGTMAAFSDDETSSGNSVSAGTLDLQSTTATGFTVTEAAPGDSNLGGTISAVYNGTVGTVEVDISDVSISDDSKAESGEYTTEKSAAAYAKQLKLDTVDAKNTTKNNTTDLLTSVTDDNGNSRKDLHDFWQNAPYDAAFGPVDNGDTIVLDLSMTLASGTTNEFQNDGVSLSVTFDAQQPSSD